MGLSRQSICLSIYLFDCLPFTLYASITFPDKVLEVLRNILNRRGGVLGRRGGVLGRRGGVLERRDRILA